MKVVILDQTRITLKFGRILAMLILENIAAAVNHPPPDPERLMGYADDDTGPSAAPPDFRPPRVPGVYLDDVKTRDSVKNYLTPASFFMLFFTHDMMSKIYEYTNIYADFNGPAKPSLYKGWTPLTPEELCQFIALIMHMAVVQTPNVECYWSMSSLFSGLWARAFMRFKAIQSFLKVSNPTNENDSDKLCKARFIHDYIRRKCMTLFQPYRCVSIEERMVRNKGRFSFRQFIKDKPTRWGMKLWVLAYACTGYTCDFEVIVERHTPVSRLGLAYDVVMRLAKSLFNQGYHIYFDNFYTSVHLLKDLLKQGTAACGTMMANGKGFTSLLKDTKQFEKKGERGDNRWKREGSVLYLQWLDNKPVSFVFTIHTSATAHDYAKRRCKVKELYRGLQVRQPKVVKDYNQNMNGVDKSDHLIGKYNSLRKTHRWWKTLLFNHFIDIARVNSYILFQDWRRENPDVEELNRSASFGQLDFTRELIRELGGIKDDQPVPLAANRPRKQSKVDHPVHPVWGTVNRNCKHCYALHKVERKTFMKCETCDNHFCFNSKRNCLWLSHT